MSAEHILERANEIATAYITKNFRLSAEAIIDGKKFPIKVERPDKELAEAVRDYNQWLNMCAGDDQATYEGYEVHIITSPDGCFLIQGKEFKGARVKRKKEND